MAVRLCCLCVCNRMCVWEYVCECVQHNFLYRQAHTHTPHRAEHCLLWLLANKTSRKVIHCIKETRRDESRQNETRRDATRPPTRETRLNIVMFRVDKGKWQHSRPTYPFPPIPQTLFLPSRSNCNFNKEKKMTEIDSCAWSALKQQKSKYSRNNSKSYISICSGTFQFD